MLLGPTRKSAYNISGLTIHSCLAVLANQPLRRYRKLDSSRLNSLRNKLGGLKVIFIDEISMVGNSMFTKAYRRFNGVDSDFGGASIIAIGDLFQLQPLFDGYVFESLKGDYSIFKQRPCGKSISPCMSSMKL